MSFAELLSELRKEKGISIRQLSFAVEKSATYMWKLEKKGEVPGCDLIERLVDFFGQQHSDKLYLAARKVPPDVIKKILEDPRWIHSIRQNNS